jgi:Transposase IS66 family
LTLADNVGAWAAALAPLHDRIVAHVLAAGRLHGDDTPMPVLAERKTNTGWLWAYVWDDRPFAGGAPPAALFWYSRDRRGEHPATHLVGSSDILQADAMPVSASSPTLAQRCPSLLAQRVPVLIAGLGADADSPCCIFTQRRKGVPALRRAGGRQRSWFTGRIGHGSRARDRFSRSSLLMSVGVKGGEAERREQPDEPAEQGLVKVGGHGGHHSGGRAGGQVQDGAPD